MKVVLTGVSSFLARMVAEQLVANKHKVLGIDRRPWPDAPKGVTMFRADVRKRGAEDVFRTQKPDALIHMATVTHFSTQVEERYRINLGGTRSVFEYCHTYGVKQALFIGRHTVYGSAPDAPIYRTEDEPPLAATTFPDLADLVAADLYAGSALWRWPEINTAVLRLVYTLGPSRRGTLARFLSGRRVPTILGFDPLFHLMHEQDAAKAIVLALESRLQGVFNIAGPPPVPLLLLCHATGRRWVPIPEMIFPALAGRLGFSPLPADAIEHLKHPIVVDAQAFKDATSFEYEYDEAQTMESFRVLGGPKHYRSRR